MNNLSKSINKALPTAKERDVLECLSSNLDFCQNISQQTEEKVLHCFQIKEAQRILETHPSRKKFYEITIDCKIVLSRIEESGGEAKC